MQNADKLVTALLCTGILLMSAVYINTGNVTSGVDMEERHGADVPGNATSASGTDGAQCTGSSCSPGQQAGGDTEANAGEEAPVEPTAALAIKKVLHDQGEGKVSIMLYNSGSMDLEGFRVSVTYAGSPEATDELQIDGTLPENAFDTFTADTKKRDIETIEVRSAQYPDAYDTAAGSQINETA